MLRSRFCTPYQNQTSAEIQYALHDNTDTPAAWRVAQIATIWGTVMSRVKIESPPSTRFIAFSVGNMGSGTVGFGRMTINHTLHTSRQMRRSFLRRRRDPASGLALIGI